MKNKGFTLLEAIIAVSLLSLIALICTMALRISLGVYENVKKHTSFFEEKAINYYRLFDQLIHTTQYPYKNQKYSLFKGDSESLEFISTVSITLSGIPGFFRIRYKFEDSSLKIKEIMLYDPDYLKKDLSNVEEEIFLSNIKEFSFKYLKNNNWTSSWQRKNLPDAIMVSFYSKGEKIEFIAPIIINKKIEK